MTSMAKRGGGRRPHGTAAVLPLLLLLIPVLIEAASCRRTTDDQPVLPPDQLANAIETVRVEHKVAPAPPKRLGFLLPADREHAPGPILCTLTQNGRPLLLAGRTRALARVDGKPMLLDLSGPMSASAAFFRAPGVTISLGRHVVVDPKADGPGIAWPVGVTVGGRDDVEDEKLDARWTCGTPAVAPVRPPLDAAKPSLPRAPGSR
jgi:hypothetical protein